MNRDLDHRKRAVEQVGRSFVVEAAAGTGKTSTLIRRILRLVLEEGPHGPPLPVTRLCAITFTEKAAGEMKVRLRQEFEEQSRRDDNVGRLARQALVDLESAAISTFHALAVSLLKERPIEAGLDPRFEALDEVRSELLFSEVWETWIGRSIAERRPPLERALNRGLRLDGLRDLASILRVHSRSVRNLELLGPPTEEEVRMRLDELRDEEGDLRSRSLDPQDKLFPHLERAGRWLRDPDAAHEHPTKPGRAGAQANWSGGKATVLQVREFIQTVVQFRASWQELPLRRAFDEVLRWMIRDFLPEWEESKRSRGVLDFDDQIWAARELLALSEDARSDFQNRFATLLVDEFQDTDPVQLEIVLLLSSLDPPSGDLRMLRPAAGRLFLVGDPKQSIYRFRGADIEAYEDVVASERRLALNLDRLELTTNYRSVPSILRFVDSVMSGVMTRPDDGPYQPDYLPFGGEGMRVEGPAPGGVHILGDTGDNGAPVGSGRLFLDAEAARVAKLIGTMVGGEAWKVRDRLGDSQCREPSWRAPRYRDIAILLPVLTRANVVEEALREADIPYVLEGGKFYYARSEVESAITVLEALANPNDPVALYGALRSIFFGLSDEDLLREHVEGRPLDYRASVPEASRLYRSYELLRDLHDHRNRREISETFELLLHRTGAREVLSARGFQSLANLGKLCRTLRSFQGDATFSQVVDLLSAIDEEGFAESESRIMEEQGDAVRVMSVHKAKGLDFPIVIVAGLGIKRVKRHPPYLADERVRERFAVRVKTVSSTLATAEWEDLLQEDKKRENAELIRLLYVALTRGADHLVLSTHHRGKRRGETGLWEADFAGTRLEPLAGFLSKGFAGEDSTARLIDAGLLDAVRRAPGGVRPAPARDWGMRLRADYQELSRLLAGAARSRNLVAASEDPEAEQRGELIAGTTRERALRIGLAFHEIMERIDFGSVESLRGCAAGVGTRYGLDGPAIQSVEEMVRRCVASEVMKRARTALTAGRRVLREVPYVRPLPAEDSGLRIEEGKIDLLFEEPDGWVMVDYKTDQVGPENGDCARLLLDRYARQMHCYAEALTEAGVRVKSSYLLLARSGTEIPVPEGDAFPG